MAAMLYCLQCINQFLKMKQNMYDKKLNEHFQHYF